MTGPILPPSSCPKRRARIYGYFCRDFATPAVAECLLEAPFDVQGLERGAVCNHRRSLRIAVNHDRVRFFVAAGDVPDGIARIASALKHGLGRCVAALSRILQDLREVGVPIRIGHLLHQVVGGVGPSGSGQQHADRDGQ